jgi:hypothetical protein
MLFPPASESLYDGQWLFRDELRSRGWLLWSVHVDEHQQTKLQLRSWLGDTGLPW